MNADFKLGWIETQRGIASLWCRAHTDGWVGESLLRRRNLAFRVGNQQEVRRKIMFCLRFVVPPGTDWFSLMVSL